jgi:group I intron endonuclease
MIGIYKITNPKGKIYVGQSIDIKKRFGRYKNLHCKMQVKIYRSLCKYGPENHKFEVLEICNLEDLNLKEQYYQELFNCLGINGLNCKITSSKDKSGYLSEETKLKIKEKATGRKASQETKQKMSYSRKGKPTSNKGKKHSDETRLKISLSNIGKKHSKESKLKISKSNLGRISPMAGKKHTEEAKKKMSLSLLGNKRGCNKIMSENEKQNLINKFSKIILNLETGIFYLGTKEAAFYNNLNHSTLKNRLNGNLKNNTNLIYC